MQKKKGKLKNSNELCNECRQYKVKPVYIEDGVIDMFVCQNCGAQYEAEDM